VTPAEMLAPQPPPQPGAQSVTDFLLARLERGGAPMLLRELVTLRREQSLAWYSAELMTLNGRHALLEQLQEAMDGLLYATQEVMEAATDERANAALQRWTAWWELARHLALAAEEAS
jgi:hypothetical protein